MAAGTVSTQLYLANVDTMLSVHYEMEPTATDFYHGDTIRHITKRTPIRRGHVVKFLTERLSDAGVTATLEADARTGQAPTIEEVTIDRTYLRRVDHTITKSIMAEAVTENTEESIYDGAVEMARQAEKALGVKENQLINSDVNSLKALVAGTYNTLGGTYNTNATGAILTVKSGAIAMFTQGETLDIINYSNGAVRATVKVNDAFYQNQVYGTDLGYPSLRVSIASTNAVGSDATLNNVTANDKLVHSGDIAASGWHAAFPSLCDVQTQTPPDYFGVDRKLVGKGYLIPHVRDYAVSSVAQPLDLDSVMDDIGLVLAQFIGPAREQLGFKAERFTRAAVLQVPPALLPSIQRQAARPGQRWTLEVPATMDAAKARAIVPVAGFDGAVLRMMGLPPIAVQVESQMQSDRIRLFEPGAFEMLELDGLGRSPHWVLNSNGGRWILKQNPDTGAVKFFMDAVCWRVGAPFCRAPRLVWEGKNILPG